MTSPAPLGQDPINRANWLGRYLGVERKFDTELKGVLLDALSGIDEKFEGLGDKFSDKIRRVQLSQSNRAVRSIITGIFGQTTNLIKEHRQDAAVAAVDAGLYDQRSILSSLIPDPVSRKIYADSLRQTGRRNIESTITRVLETEKPLSARVYRSEALAKGQVSQVINRALARGDSAANIARDVKAMIDPAVPGGVSYAAKRLGRTEINNAFHAQSIHDAQQSPWVDQMHWYLSKVHEIEGCLCERYALIGLFPIDQVPEKPHPNCRCFVTPELPNHQDFENRLMAGQFDDYLDDVLGFEPIKGAQSARETIDVGLTSRVQVELAKKSPYPDKNWTSNEKKAFQKEIARRQLAAENVVPEKPKKIKDDTVPKNIGAAANPRQVQNWLHHHYEGLEVTGLDTTDIHIDSAKEIATAFVDRQAKHPKTNIRALKVVDTLPDSVPAETRYNYDGKQRSDIIFNRKYVADYNLHKTYSEQNQRTNWHGKRNTEKPWEGTTIHEWGHVVDYSGDGEVGRSLEPLPEEALRIPGSRKKKRPVSEHQKVGRGLYENYLTEVRGLDLNFDDIPAGAEKAYETWVLDGLPSGYSFDDEARTIIEPVEATAEGYAEVVNNPDASDVSISIYRKLIETLKGNRDLVVGVTKRG